MLSSQRRAMVFSVVLALGSGCDGADPPGDGVLLITVVSADLAGTELEGLESLRFVSTRAEVIHRTACEDPATERRLVVAVDRATTDLVTERPNVASIVAKLPVPAGCVMQVRFIAEELTGWLEGDQVPVRIPSGPQTGIKIVPTEGEPPFRIEGSKTTAVRIEYDPSEKLVVNRGQGYIEKPVLEARVVDPNFAVGFVLDEIIVAMEVGTPQDAIEAAAAGIGGTIAFQHPRHVATIRLPNTDMMRDAIDHFDDVDGVVVCRPNVPIVLAEPNEFPAPDEPNDPFWIDREPGGFEHLNLTTDRALDAWRVTTGHNSVLVAVVDNGVEILHAELLNNIWINESEAAAFLPAGWTDDGDGVLTFADLNSDLNAGLCPEALSPPVDVCDPRDLVDGHPGSGYGWQDGDDPDGGGEYPDDLIGWDFVDGDNLPLPALDRPSPYHGTGVAGILAGQGHNGLAAPGVAWHARVIPVRSMGGRTGTDDHVLAGVAYAIARGARVINMSLGGVRVRQGTESEGEVAILCGESGVTVVPSGTKWDEGVRRDRHLWLQELAGLDRNSAVIVAALGNCHGLDADVPGEVYQWPAVMGATRPDLGYDEPAQPTMIGVAGIETWNQVAGVAWGFPPRATVSTRGRTTGHIAAPATGWRILTVGPPAPAGLVTDTTDCGNGPYPSCEGTSLAVPQVAGTAALVFAHEPLLDAPTVRVRVLDAAWTGDLGFIGVVEGDRVLDVGAAVGVAR